jgi:hypothetical protein
MRGRETCGTQTANGSEVPANADGPAARREGGKGKCHAPTLYMGLKVTAAARLRRHRRATWAGAAVGTM